MFIQSTIRNVGLYSNQSNSAYKYAELEADAFVYMLS